MENNKNDFDIDNILENDDIFKPLTDGLGFHHSIKDEQEVNIQLKEKQALLKSSLEMRGKEINSKVINSKPVSSFKSETKIDMGELAPFYNTPVKKETVSINIEEDNEAILNQSGMASRAMAYAIDLTVIFSLVLLSSVSIIFLADLPLSFIRDSFAEPDLLISFAFISTMFYTFYFSFLDKTDFSTIGKRILGIKVTGIDNKPLSLTWTFIRTLVCLIGMGSLGLSSILRIQDKLTDAQVVVR